MNITTKKTFVDVIDNLDVGYWKLEDNTSYWSKVFINGLGFNEDEVTISLDFFINTLLEEKYRNPFRDNYFSLINKNINFSQQVNILNKSGEYKEYICKTNDSLPLDIKVNANYIFFIEKKHKTHEKVSRSNFYYGETAEMTRTGSWYVDFLKQKSYWDYESKRILEYPQDYIPSLNKSHKYYAPEHLELAAKLFMGCSMGTPFKTEIKMLTANNRQFWVTAIGKPVYNDDKEITGIRGIFQDIDKQKQKEITLQRTSDIIGSQNSRLLSFAHIVSHNLRSHTSNLELIVRLIEGSETDEEKLELIDSIKDISGSLNSTIEHLNEIVTIQTQNNHRKEDVSFIKILKNIKKSINSILKTTNTTINADFTEVKSIRYVPAYLESILLNLLTNAIKYKHETREPVINIKTYIENEKVFLSFQDNGSGIDMEKFGNKIFGMYKTFHYNEDAVGIGLFLVKNQIQSLNGDISADSKINEGTTFKIQF